MSNHATGLICNALNNMQSEVVVFEQAVLDVNPDLAKIYGVRLCSLELFTADSKRRALDWYEANTDWSAFKRADMVAARALLA